VQNLPRPKCQSWRPQHRTHYHWGFMSRDAFCQGKANGKNSISDSGLFSIRAVKFDLLDLVDFGDMAVSLDTVKVVNIKSQITIKIKKKQLRFCTSPSTSF